MDNNNLQITGTIIQKPELQSGTSKAGNPWQKQGYVLETITNFPRKIYFTFFGERVNQYPLNIGDLVTVSFDIESREYNGRWYTDINAWKAEKADQGTPAGASAAPAAQSAPAPNADPFGAPAAPFAPDAGGSQKDDLPFF